MTPIMPRKDSGRRRIGFVLFVVACLSLSLTLALCALRDDVSLFFSPREVVEKHIPQGRSFRLGGLVKKGSLKNRSEDLAIAFIVTDLKAETAVEYKGILPDLFREGQGVVAKGNLDERGVFIAVELLAKHDENYMPPEVARALQP